MTTTNNITGDRITSKANSQEFRDNYEAIFGSKKCQHEWVSDREGVKKICEKCMEVK